MKWRIAEIPLVALQVYHYFAIVILKFYYCQSWPSSRITQVYCSPEIFEKTDVYSFLTSQSCNFYCV